MQFLKFAAGLGLAMVAAAQSSTLYFTNAPSNVQAGQPVVLKYVAPDLSKPVSITLRQGSKDSLATLATLTTTSSGGSYDWIPSQDLVAATNYALEITQGDQVNYIGPFSLAGGLAFSATGTPASATTTPGSYDASSPSLMSAISSLSSALSSNVNAALSTMTPSPYGSLTLASGSGTVPMSRNTTFQSATLSPTNTGTLNPTQGTSVSPGESQSPVPTGATLAAGTSDASLAKVPFSLLVGTVAAFIYLA